MEAIRKDFVPVMDPERIEKLFKAQVDSMERLEHLCREAVSAEERVIRMAKEYQKYERRKSWAESLERMFRTSC
jgi:hypothetical protein